MADLSTPGAARIRGAREALYEVRPDLNAAAVQVFLAQVKGENDFGYGFTTPDGTPSNNWGAIYAKGDRGTIPVGDTQDGKPFTASAAWWSTPEGGANQFVRLVTGSSYNALGPASAGDLFAYAKALFRNGTGYFGGFPPGHKWSLAPKDAPLHGEVDHYYRILAYAKLIESNAKIVASALGQPLYVKINAPNPPDVGIAGFDPRTVFGTGLIGIAAYFWWKSRKAK